VATDQSSQAVACEGVASKTLPDSRQLVVIQRNPTSGSGRGAKQLLILIRELRNYGFRVRLFASRERLDAFLQQTAVRIQVRCIVAAGGDGTVGSVVNRHADLPIATLPLGTENLLARHLKISRCGATVARLINAGVTRQFDIGSANGQQFLLMLSIGVDAEVVRRLHSGRIGNISRFSYLWPVVTSFLGYSFPKLSVYSSDGQLLATGTHVIATNIPEYGFRIPFAPNANPHDGLLDVRVLQVKGNIATVLHALKMRLGWQDRNVHVRRFLVNEIEVRSEQNITPSQCDGDPGPDCPVKAFVRADAMTLIVAEQKESVRKKR